MTASSEYSGLVHFPPAPWLDADEPVDTATVRDGIINNARHHYDCAPQQIAAWVAPTGTFLEPEIAPGRSETDYSPMARVGPFPLVIRTDRRTAKVIVRLGVRVANATTGTFLVILRRPIPVGLRGRPPEDGPHVGTVTTTSLTSEWQDLGALQVTQRTEVEDSVRLVTMERNQVAGELGTVEVPLFVLDIYAKTATGGVNPQLVGVYARSFIG